MKSPIENLPFIPRLVLGLVFISYGSTVLWWENTSFWIDFTRGAALSFGFISLLTLLPEAKEKMKRN